MIPLNTKKVSMLLNSSNQVNLLHTKESHTLQANLIILLGKNQLGSSRLNPLSSETKIPLRVQVNKEGEVNIKSVSGLNVDDHIQVYTDKKISLSEKGGN